MPRALAGRLAVGAAVRGLEQRRGPRAGRLVIGRVLNPGFLDYKLLTTPDMPEILIPLIETVDEAGPFGAKGLGEAGTIPIPAAVANAVKDAVGVRMTELPMTPERVYRAVCAARARPGPGAT